jgi:hypothetical protein
MLFEAPDAATTTNASRHARASLLSPRQKGKCMRTVIIGSATVLVGVPENHQASNVPQLADSES